jgi:hypothetical protein
MAIIRRTLLIFLVLFSLSSAAFGAATHSGTDRMVAEPPPKPTPESPGWPDNGEPDGGGNAKTNGGDPTREDLTTLLRLFGKILMARNLGIGL